MSNNQGSYAIAKQKIECPHCSCRNFDRRQILLNTRGFTFFNFDWLNRGATALVCRNCSRVELFQDEPEETE